MKLNLTANKSSDPFSCNPPKSTRNEGMKIREMKLQTKYKQMIQKHQTLKKLTHSPIAQIDIEESDDTGLIDNYGEVKTGRDLVLSRKNEESGEIVKKQYEFLTARNLLKTPTHQPKTLFKHSINRPINPPPSIPNQQLPHPEPSHQQHLQTREFIHKLDTEPKCYQNLWQKFFKSVQQIQINQENLCLAHVCEEDRRLKLVEAFMKEIEFLLDQHDRQLLDVTLKIEHLKDHQLKPFFLQSHHLHQKLTQSNLALDQHLLHYQTYLQSLKQQQTERRLMLQSKRQSCLTKTQSISPDHSPLRHLHKDLNINQKQLKSIMQKKSKLNLQLDLNFQIQQRRKISKQKQTFNQNKLKLQKEKSLIEQKMKQLKQKIQFKEKQTQRYEFQKDKHHKEIQYFFKMLLKNPEYRLDGVLWTFKKMIQYGFEPQLSDFSDSLDSSAKAFLLHQFQIIKQQQVYTLKPIETKKHRLITSQKTKKTSNRHRVRSVTVSNIERQNQNPINILDDFNSSTSTNSNDKAFFTFGLKNSTLKPAQNLSIRKKSGSLTLMKTYDDSLGQTESAESKMQPKPNSFTALTKQNNRNKLYFSAKNYIKNWISDQGWNLGTGRTIKKVQDNKVEEKFISEEKARTKQKFFKVGRSNTRYNSIVKTLYGSEEDLKNISKRAKTCHQ